VLALALVVVSRASAFAQQLRLAKLKSVHTAAAGNQRGEAAGDEGQEREALAG